LLAAWREEKEIDEKENNSSASSVAFIVCLWELYC
jgi:hypothetical protein